MTEAIKSTCPYCGVGCGLLVERKPDESWLVRGDPEHPSNYGKLCSKGVALNETIDHSGRLLHPFVEGKRASWNDALETVASRFQEIIEEHGPDAVAFYVSGQLLTEDYYLANKLMKGFIGSGNIDTNSRLCMASSVAGHKRAFGSDTVPGCYDDFEQAELIVLTGSNTAWSHPVLYRRIVKAKERNPQLKVVVIDPRRTNTCDAADIHLPLLPGTDSLFFMGLLTWLHDQNIRDLAFVQAHTEGIEAALRLARWYARDVPMVAKACGLSESAVRTVYQWFGETEKTITLYSQGINQTSSGTDKVNTIINCHLYTNRIGRPGMGPFSITGQPNAMGGREVGALANQLVCHMDIENDAHRALVGRFWETNNLTQRPGLKAAELFPAIQSGRIKAVWVMATNPAVTLPDAQRVRDALNVCEFVVVSENIQSTDTSAYANVLLPASAWGERNGTVTSSERAITRQLPFLPEPGSVKPDWWIVAEIAKRLGYPGFEFSHPHEIFSEYARLSGFENQGRRDFDISGLAELSRDEYDELTPIRWPVTAQNKSGTARLFADGHFFTPTAKAQFIPVTPRPPGFLPDTAFPLVLNTARVRDQWHTMTRTGKSARLSGHDNEPFVEFHPKDGERYDLKEGELVRLTSQWGSVIVRGRSSDAQMPGQVLVPMHWNDQFASDGAVNKLVNPVFDPVSGQPEFKHTPVTMCPYRPAWHGFLLSRTEVQPQRTSATYWAKAKRDALWHYELAGEEAVEDWSSFARELLESANEPTQWAEMLDKAGGQYRGVSIVDERLQSCLFIGPTHELPKRDWLVRLFSRERLDRQERMRLLAGSPGSARDDEGKIVCACFNVGENTLLRGIREQGLTTPEALGEALSAGTNCGSCIPEIKALIEASKEPSPTTN